MTVPAGPAAAVGWFTDIAGPARRTASKPSRMPTTGYVSRVHLVPAAVDDTLRGLGRRAKRRDVLNAYVRLFGEARMSALCGVPVPPHAYASTRLGCPDLSGDACPRCVLAAGG